MSCWYSFESCLRALSDEDQCASPGNYQTFFKVQRTWKGIKHCKYAFTKIIIHRSCQQRVNPFEYGYISICTERLATPENMGGKALWVHYQYDNNSYHQLHSDTSSWLVNSCGVVDFIGILALLSLIVNVSIPISVLSPFLMFYKKNIYKK